MTIPNKVTALKMLQADGTYTGNIPIESDAANVVYNQETNETLKEAVQKIEETTLPEVSEADESKIVAAKDGKQVIKEDFSFDLYTKEQMKDRQVPISAAIRPTVNGNPAVCENSKEQKFQGLKIYGKSTQDGTPSPENPVPIVSAGEGGSITLSITDGAEQSQSLPLSTPSGLPGIPVDSGGNYTDASGQQYVSNFVDLEAMAKTQYISRYMYSDLTFKKDFFIQNGIQMHCFSAEVLPEIKERTKGLCNIFIWAYFINPIPGLNFTIDERKIRVFFNDSVETVEQANRILAEKNAEFLVQLATPITTPLSDEEIAAYRALTTYPGTTVVSTAEPVAGIEASYVADTTKYINQKINEIVPQTILLTQGGII